jgi:hypothetical protein
MDGTYYPHLIRQINQSDEIWSGAGADFTGKSYAIRTLVVNQVIPQRKAFKRIRIRDTVSKDQDLFKLSYPYHPSFWKDYNLLLLRPLDQQTQKDLEKHGRLEEQFRRNGAQ